MLATQTMMQLGVPLNRVLRRLREVRQERYRLTGSYFHGVTDEQVEDADQPRLHTVIIGASAACVGRTIGEIEPQKMGVEITAIRRTGSRDVNPSPETSIQGGDVLVLLGTQANLARAEMRLLQG
jgi:Putative regulatory, ligand-binding protein related to C-terminal domains of K+ channels